MTGEIEPFWNQGMAFCPVCQTTLSEEEIAFDACDCCGGEGIGGDEDLPLEWIDGRWM